MKPQEVGLRLAALTALKSIVEDEIEGARAAMSSALLDVQSATGADRIVVSLPGEGGPVKVASVSLLKEEPGVSIDPGKLLAWCREHAPDEVVCAVRDSFRRGLLTHLIAAGDDVVDRRTGMVVDFATPKPAAPASGRFTLRFEGGTNGIGRELLADAWRGGELDKLGVLGTPALPGGAS